MLYLEFLFWICLLLNCYIYFGYGLLLMLLVRLKTHKKKAGNKRKMSRWPAVTLVIAAYNEEEFIVQKLMNSLQLDYPSERLKILVITDGSNDQTPHLVKTFPEAVLLHQSERKGKAAALNRAMRFVNTPFTLFTDANTLVNPEAIKKMIRHFSEPKTGAVAGEKRVRSAAVDNATGAGEGTYWRYESYLKRLDAQLYSVVGAAGELYAIRTQLYEPLREDVLVEDFYLTLRMAQNGYRVAYEPQALALEEPSESLQEEWKRRVRIAAGGWQATWRLRSLLNPFRYGVLTFQYVSHRVLRWTIGPASLPLIFLSGALLAGSGQSLYSLLFALQGLFYVLAFLAWFNHEKKFPSVFFLPFYFLMMNACMYAGLHGLLSGSQSVKWKKARRKKQQGASKHL